MTEEEFKLRKQIEHLRKLINTSLIRSRWKSDVIAGLPMSAMRNINTLKDSIVGIKLVDKGYEVTMSSGKVYYPIIRAVGNNRYTKQHIRAYFDRLEQYGFTRAVVALKHSLKQLKLYTKSKM